MNAQLPSIRRKILQFNKRRPLLQDGRRRKLLVLALGAHDALDERATRLPGIAKDARRATKETLHWIIHRLEALGRTVESVEPASRQISS